MKEKWYSLDVDKLHSASTGNKFKVLLDWIDLVGIEINPKDDEEKKKKIEGIKEFLKVKEVDGSLWNGLMDGVEKLRKEQEEDGR